MSEFLQEVYRSETPAHLLRRVPWRPGHQLDHAACFVAVHPRRLEFGPGT